jgi:hypothetical protein
MVQGRPPAIADAKMNDLRTVGGIQKVEGEHHREAGLPMKQRRQGESTSRSNTLWCCGI